MRKAFWVKVGLKWKLKFKPVVILWKVWTHESYHKLAKYDCPGECSPEKECLWWRRLKFQQPERIHHQGQASWLWWCQCQSMSPQTVLLRSTLPQMIILHGLMVIILKKRWSCVWTNMHWILLYSHFNSSFLQIWIHKILTFLPGKIVHHLAPDQCF